MDCVSQVPLRGRAGFDVGASCLSCLLTAITLV